MKIAIRSDSGSEIGIGHLSRDLVLAKRLQKEKIDVSFAVLDTKGNQNNLIVEKGLEFHVLKDDSVETLILYLISNNISLLIIDHYKIGYEEEKKIKENTKCVVMVFVDKVENHYCDILLNHNISSEKEWYTDKVQSGTLVFSGIQYHFLNDRFDIVNRTISKNPKNILVIMGGSDPNNISSEILELLGDEYNLTIATTSANPFFNHLQKLKKSYNFDLYIDFENMSELMKNADLGIFSASTLISESISSGLPFIAVKLVDNQKNMYNYLKKIGLPVIEKNEINMLNSMILSIDEYLPLMEREIVSIQKELGSSIDTLIKSILEYTIINTTA